MGINTILASIYEKGQVQERFRGWDLPESGTPPKEDLAYGFLLSPSPSVVHAFAFIATYVFYAHAGQDKCSSNK